MFSNLARQLGATECPPKPIAPEWDWKHNCEFDIEMRFRLMNNENEKRESGLPGGGAGRKDDVGHSGVYPMSGPHPRADAPIIGQAGWGQGRRGSAGYEDHGESELTFQAVAPERCRDMMTKDPVCCLPGDSAAQAARLMKEHDIGILPVVASKEDKDLIGVVTDRDIAIRVVAEGADPAQIKLDSILSRSPVVCSPDDPYQKLLQMMERRQVRRVPIVDQAGRLVGIVSQADVALRTPDKKETAEVVEEISRRAA
jgi:CBS domain-containing protein